MNTTPPLPSLSAHGACQLPHLGVIRATGVDAASFLHNQLTQDFLLLDANHARLAAFCNAKGRMQASMIGFKTGPEEVLLVMRQDLSAQTMKRLSMFVLRAKVKLTDASAALGVWGVFHAVAQEPWSCHQLGEATNSVAKAATESVVTDRAWALALYPAVNMSRSLHVLPHPIAPELPALPLEDWLLGEVLCGIADVQTATFESFVPQMLNYESVDGVNFKKGCYPGQEVVARSQFRGTLKRRTYLVSASVPLQAGQEIFAATPSISNLEVPDETLDTPQPVGMVAQAASHSLHGHWGLVCLQTSSTEGSLQVNSVHGADVRLHPLPYNLRDDI